jgi:septum formation protein
VALLVLASGSPRRLELLSRFDIAIRVAVPDVDENCDLPAGQAVGEISQRKAKSVEFCKDETVIAADTLVEIDGHTLGKPADKSEAQKMLEQLSGRWHNVYTGVTVFNGHKIITETEHTRVKFAALTKHDIMAYVATKDPLDKAGAYGIQGRGALLVTNVEGDFYNVMGLPLFRLGQMLNEFGIRLI